MRIQDLVKSINNYRHMAGGIQQEFPFSADFAGLPDDDRDVIILTTGRLRFCKHGKQYELGCFSTLEEAIAARREAEEQYKKEMKTMATSEAQKRATRKYQASLKTFTIKLKPDELARYKQAAKRQGKTFRHFVLSAMEAATVER